LLVVHDFYSTAAGTAEGVTALPIFWKMLFM